MAAASRSLLVLPLLACLACEEPPPKPENLLVVCLDTVRYDVFHALDDAAEALPADPFLPWSRRALHFDGAIAPAPWTIPSVASALTGRAPRRHGAGRFPELVARLDEEVPSGLARDVTTLPEWLRGLGFDTAAFVGHSWFRSRFGLARGFEQLRLLRPGERIVSAASAWIEAREPAQPFFLYLHFMDAHEHFSWAAASRKQRAASLLPEQRRAVLAVAPPALCRDPESDGCIRFLAYAGAVAEQRAFVAELLGRLQARGLLDRTLVWLYADHGEEFEDHAEEARRLDVDPRGIHGLGHGHALFQELLHVPLLAWHPGLPPGRVSERAGLADIAPSSLAWLGLAAGAPPFDGRSLAASDAEGAPFVQFSAGIAYGPEQLAVVRGDRKRVVHLASGARALYDLSADPRETRPLAGEAHAEEAAALDALLREYAGEPLPERPAAPELSPEEVRMLQRLGYLEGRAEAVDDDAPEVSHSGPDSDAAPLR